MTSFAETIEQNRQVPVDPVELYRATNKGASVDVRRRGSIITGLCLETNHPHIWTTNVLYADTEMLDQPKLPASHPAFPFGRHEGLGGQHGWPRYADFELFSETSSSLRMSAGDPAEVPVMTRAMRLARKSFSLSTQVENATGEAVDGSVAEHYYFVLPGDLKDVRINDKKLSSVMGKDAVNDIDNGVARFMTINTEPVGESGRRLPTTRVHLFHGIDIELDAMAMGDAPSADADMSLVFWRRPGSASLCIEPVYGARLDDDGNLINTELVLAHGESVALNTEIRTQ